LNCEFCDTLGSPRKYLNYLLIKYVKLPPTLVRDGIQAWAGISRNIRIREIRRTPYTDTKRDTQNFWRAHPRASEDPILSYPDVSQIFVPSHPRKIIILLSHSHTSGTGWDLSHPKLSHPGCDTPFTSLDTAYSWFTKIFLFGTFLTFFSFAIFRGIFLGSDFRIEISKFPHSGQFSGYLYGPGWNLDCRRFLAHNFRTSFPAPNFRV